MKFQVKEAHPIMLTPVQYLLAALAALVAGAVNALAGGGTLITFPMLTLLSFSAAFYVASVMDKTYMGFLIVGGACHEALRHRSEALLSVW